MKCHFCGHLDTKVIDSRTADDNTVIRRRRACEKCNERFTTFERLETIPMAVIKRNGARESFDRVKLLNGIVKSCNKRPVSIHQMEQIVDEIEQAIHNSLRKEIASNEVGEMVMKLIKQVDQVAYIRFASVYKHFTDIDTFMSELTTLMKDR